MLQMRLYRSGILALAVPSAGCETEAAAIAFIFPPAPRAASVAAYAARPPRESARDEAQPDSGGDGGRLAAAERRAESALGISAARVQEQILSRYAPSVTGEAPEYLAAVLQCVVSKLLG